MKHQACDHVHLSLRWCLWLSLRNTVDGLLTSKKITIAEARSGYGFLNALNCAQCLVDHIHTAHDDFFACNVCWDDCMSL